MTTPAADLDELTTAIRIATEAARGTLEHFPTWRSTDELDVDTKGDGTPVTIADRRAETEIRNALADAFPDDAVVGEEHPDATGVSGRTWIIDPIDGTKAFMRGVPLYSTLLAMWDEHGPAIGVVVFPALDEVLAAGRGLGCTWNGRPARARARDEVAGALVTSSTYGNWPPDTVASLIAADTLPRTWGDAYGYALVATGRADAMIDTQLEWWDVAPMPVILTEAGGRLTRLDGGPIIGGFGSAIATGGGAIHDELRSLFPAEETP